MGFYPLLQLNDVMVEMVISLFCDAFYPSDRSCGASKIAIKHISDLHEDDHNLKRNIANLDEIDQICK